MRHFLAPIMILAATCGHTQTTIRFWFAYGSEGFASFARANGDPLAAVGKEIPPGPLRVPHAGVGGGTFKVQLWREVTGATFEHRYSSGGRINIAFDRTFCGDSNTDPPLISESFRKVQPKYLNSLRECITNGSLVDAWIGDEAMDVNNDGIQDTAQIRPFQSQGVFLQGIYGSGESLRPVGLAAYAGAYIVDPPGFEDNRSGMRLYRGVPQRMFDIEWQSNLALDETYGFGEGETGLWIWTTNPSTGLANNTAIWDDAVHIGARYNLIGAVPEPSSVMALGAGLLLIRRRQRRSPG
jgi:hypothetical protein